MAIYKRCQKKGEVYLVRLVKNGKRINRTFTRKIEAIQFEQKAKLDCSDLCSSMSFKSAIERWLTNHADIRKSKASIHSDKSMLKRILPKLGGIKLEKIQAIHIDEYVCDLKKASLSNSTVNKHLQLIGAVLNYHFKRGNIYKNPMVAVSKLKQPELNLKFWSIEEANRFLEYTAKKYLGTDKESYHLIYKVALNTGMRKGELLGLRWNCVDLNQGMITVCRVYSGHQREIVETTKSGKIRVVPISDELVEDLLNAKRNGDLVFQHNGKVIDPDHLYSRYFKRDVKESGVTDIRFHDLRHTFASNYIMSNGSNLYDLQKILGHADFKMTQRYAKFSSDYLRTKKNIVCFSEKTNIVEVDFQKKII